MLLEVLTRLRIHSDVDIKNNQVEITIQANAYGFISELLLKKL